MSKAKRSHNKSPLDARRRVFVDRYLQSWNATDAARVAGYTGPGLAGWRLAQDPQVKAAIERRLATYRLSADEVISRLSEQSKGDISEFLAFDAGGRPYVNVKAMVEAGKGYLIREISYTKAGEVIVKFHDTLKAMELLGKVHGIFKDGGQQGDSLATMPLPAIIERLQSLGRAVETWPAGLVEYAKAHDLLPANK